MLLQIFAFVLAWRIVQLFTAKIRRLGTKLLSNKSPIGHLEAQLQRMHRELARLSSVDSFAQWARLQRKIEQAEKDLNAERSTHALAEVKADWLAWALQSALGMGLRALVLFTVPPEPLSALCRGPWAVCLVVQRPVLWMAVCEVALWLIVDRLN